MALTAARLLECGSNRGSNRLRGPRHVDMGHGPLRQVRGEDEGDFRLTRGWSSPVEPDRFVVPVPAVGEQRSEVGLPDAALRRFVREPDLPAAGATTRGDCATGVDLLHGVRLLHVAAGDEVAHRCTRHARLSRDVQSLRCLLDRAHDGAPASRLAIRPNTRAAERGAHACHAPADHEYVETTSQGSGACGSGEGPDNAGRASRTPTPLTVCQNRCMLRNRFYLTGWWG